MWRNTSSGYADVTFHCILLANRIDENKFWKNIKLFCLKVGKKEKLNNVCFTHFMGSKMNGNLKNDEN